MHDGGEACALGRHRLTAEEIGLMQPMRFSSCATAFGSLS
jgi:hypothetical protein